jgi:3'5'-cyclic nucleotide phosphodiesterase
LVSTVEGSCLRYFIVIFEQLELTSEINKEKLRPFLTEVSNNYAKTPYHNFTHAFTLVHFAYWLIKNIEVDKFLLKDDILAVIVACVGHDLNHPGMNNVYICKTKDDLAILYNDVSVLENMHISLLYQIMNRNNEELNILDTLSKQRYEYVRQMIIQGILDTDMVKHFTIIETLKA